MYVKRYNFQKLAKSSKLIERHIKYLNLDKQEAYLELSPTILYLKSTLYVYYSSGHNK